MEGTGGLIMKGVASGLMGTGRGVASKARVATNSANCNGLEFNGNIGGKGDVVGVECVEPSEESEALYVEEVGLGLWC